MAEHNQLGKWGEEQACLFLESKGYRILERNWYYQKAEIDIICEMKNEIIFVEVKTLMDDVSGMPEDQVTVKKERMTTEAADQYMENKNFSQDARFDIISILKNKNQLRHIKDAFRPTIK